MEPGGEVEDGAVRVGGEREALADEVRVLEGRGAAGRRLLADDHDLAGVVEQPLKTVSPVALPAELHACRAELFGGEGQHDVQLTAEFPDDLQAQYVCAAGRRAVRRGKVNPWRVLKMVFPARWQYAIKEGSKITIVSFFTNYIFTAYATQAVLFDLLI